MKVVGIAGAAIAALLVGQSIFGGGDGGHEGHSASAPTKQSGDLPAAGGGPKGVAPADGSPDAQQGRASQSAAPKVVTLHMTPSGKGRVGAIVTVRIHNGTDDPLTVMATTIKGDGRSAIVGEGTLAPGSRVVEPGEDGVGTVEFSSSKAPQQVALVDLSGNVIAASS